MTNKDKENGKLCAILTWFLPLVGLIWYFADDKMRKNKFAGFHLKQVLVLVIVSLVINIGALIVGGILAFIPILGWIVGILLWILVSIVNVAIFVFWVMGLISAFQGKEKELPLIGKFGKKFTF